MNETERHRFYADIPADLFEMMKMVFKPGTRNELMTIFLRKIYDFIIADPVKAVTAIRYGKFGIIYTPEESDEN